MAESTPKLTCALFRKREWGIKELTRDINAARNASDKADLASRLMKEVENLLSCERFSDSNSECRKCRTISLLRKQTAELVIRATTLPR